jgi:hypothetical protein
MPRSRKAETSAGAGGISRRRRVRLSFGRSGVAPPHWVASSAPRHGRPAAAGRRGSGRDKSTPAPHRNLQHRGDLATRIRVIGRADQGFVLVRHHRSSRQVSLLVRAGGRRAPVTRRGACRRRFTIGPSPTNGSSHRPVAGRATRPEPAAAWSSSTEGSHQQSVSTRPQRAVHASTAAQIPHTAGAPPVGRYIPDDIRFPAADPSAGSADRDRCAVAVARVIPRRHVSMSFLSRLRVIPIRPCRGPRPV